MNYKTGLFPALLCLGLIHLVAPAAIPQEDPGKPKIGDSPKTEEKKKPADPHITVIFRISVEGKSAIPAGSTVELNGDDESCKKLTLNKHLDSNGVTITDLPVCKVKLKIYISGFDSKTVTLDLGKYKDDPVQIQVKEKGAPVVSP